MKNLLLIFIFFVLSFPLISQSPKIITLDTCLIAAVNNHPLVPKKELLAKNLEIQKKIQKISNLPDLSWNASAKLQSESIFLDIDNPMFPVIEIPLYSANTTLELKYSIYNGNVSQKKNKLNEAINKSMIFQTDLEIDKIKSELVKNYLLLLFNKEMEKVLVNTLDRLQLNLKRLEAGIRNGIINKSDLLHLKVKQKDLENQLFSVQEERKSLLTTLQSLTMLEIDEESIFTHPTLLEFAIDNSVERKEIEALDYEIKILDEKSKMQDIYKKPKVFAFANAGLGYPNPLNFFDDALSPFAVGGIGFSWKFYDWGKVKEEKKLIKIQQEMLKSHQNDIETRLNRYNDKYLINISSLQKLIEKEKEVMAMKEEISEIQRTKMEKGILVSSEYISSLNDVIDSKLKTNRYQLELIQLKLEYLILKGKL